MQLVNNPDPENAPFALCSDSEDSKALPRPRGNAPKPKKINPREQYKLDSTKEFGGLIPEISPVLNNLCRLIGILKHDE